MAKPIRTAAALSAIALLGCRPQAYGSAAPELSAKETIGQISANHKQNARPASQLPFGNDLPSVKKHHCNQLVKGKELTMQNTLTSTLPLSISANEISGIEILYGFYSAKTGAGVQEVQLFGDGRAVLRRTASREAAAETFEGHIETSVVIRLLELMADERFDQLEEHYRAEAVGRSRRILKLTASSRSKTIIVEEAGCPEFERITAALKMAISIVCPEVLQQRFFPNL